MTIPASFLSAVLPNTLPVVQQTARTLAYQATKAFGEWFQSPQEADSGPSVPTSGATKEPERYPPDPWAFRSSSNRNSLQEKLGQWLRSFANQMGLGDQPPAITIVADGVGIPRIEGPEDFATGFRESLLGQPELVDAINQVARHELESDPLQWMPGHEPLVRIPISARPTPALKDGIH
jgi:hypothetical protein